MAWNPAAQVIDLVPIADNLLAYIEANQTDALDWANGGPGLRDFAKFYTNASGRLQTIFPSLMVLSQQAETDLSGDVNVAGLQLTLEGTVGGPDADQLVSDTKRYAKAVESMLANISEGALTSGVDTTTRARIFELETRLDILGGRSAANAFTQIFQTRVVYRLESGAI